MNTPNNGKPDALDHIEKYASKRQVQQAYFATDGPRGIALATAAKLIQTDLAQKTWQLHELIKWVDEEGLWGEIPRDLLARISRPRRANRAPEGACHADIDFCRGKQDGCKALGLPHDTERMLAFVEGNDGARIARQFAVLPAGALREANRLPKAQKKALLAEAKELADLLPEDAAEHLAEMIVRHTETITVEREQARVKADDELNRRLEADRKLAKSREAEKAAVTRAQEVKREADELRRTLEAPFFEGDLSEQARKIQELDAVFLGHLKFVVKAARELAGRVAQKKGSDELNQLVLRHVELMTNLAGSCFSKFLSELDPDQAYTAFWATRTLFASAGTEADIEAYWDTLGLCDPPIKKKNK